MAKSKEPTAEDRATAIRVALSGIAGGLELGEVAARLALLHPKNDTFPGEVLVGLAADAIEESGATREHPLEFEGIRKRHLPEDRAIRGPSTTRPSMRCGRRRWLGTASTPGWSTR